uniref:Large ribosomal subunit protein uL24c n=1 Tax=Pterothamnion crispum TaxID=1550583 RepID=A0A4D6X0X4_9FLOR|nr:ribosomal protein L24 [Pterothamnion crispum]
MKRKNYKTQIKKNDNIIITAGKYKGQEGKVMKIISKKNTVIIENLNLKTKHSKPSREDETGTIKKIEAPIHTSNVSLLKIT